MHFQTSKVGIALSISAAVNAHYTLVYPNPIGTYSDVDMPIGPCDGYDPTTVTTFQDYPWRGEALSLFTTHPSVIWNFNVALFSDVKNDQSAFIPMTENVQQNNGTGELCFGQVPGKKEWVGQKAIIQMIQNAPDGKLYTCVAVTFTDATPDNGGSACSNFSGPQMLPYDIFWLPGTGSDLNVVSTSSSSSSTTTTPGTTSSHSNSGGGVTTTSSSEGASKSTSSGTKSGTSSGSPSSSTTKSSGSGPTGTTTSKGSGAGGGAGATSSSGLGSGSNSTGSSTSTPTPFAGASDKTQAKSIAVFAGLAFAALMVLGF